MVPSEMHTYGLVIRVHGLHCDTDTGKITDFGGRWRNHKVMPMPFTIIDSVLGQPPVTAIDRVPDHPPTRASGGTGLAE
jgi:hypothetical protein